MSNNIQIKSLHQIIEQLEKRLEHLEVKGEVGDVKIQSAVPTPHACYVVRIMLTIVLMGLRCYMISFQLGEWPGRKYTIEYRMDTLTIVSMETLFLSIFNISSKQEI